LAVIVVSLAGFGLRMRRVVDEMMFKPHARDRVRMAAILAKRFGSKVRLIDVPFVDRDVNGIVGVVEAAPGFVPKDLEEPGFVLAFERRDGRLIALTATRPYELRLTRKNYRHR